MFRLFDAVASLSDDQYSHSDEPKVRKNLKSVDSSFRICKYKNMKQGYVYIITNHKNTTLYTGVTSNLIKRIYEHKEKLTEGFSKKYNLNKLVYYEVFDDIANAIHREKEIKGKSRQYKIDLIVGMNSDWQDLFDTIL